MDNRLENSYTLSDICIKELIVRAAPYRLTLHVYTYVNIYI